MMSYGSTLLNHTINGHFLQPDRQNPMICLQKLDYCVHIAAQQQGELAEQ
jgi:hypothetical protein